LAVVKAVAIVPVIAVVPPTSNLITLVTSATSTIVVVESDNFLLVKVSVVALPTKVSLDVAGSVKVLVPAIAVA
jgi:hypothetical protein